MVEMDQDQIFFLKYQRGEDWTGDISVTLFHNDKVLEILTYHYPGDCGNPEPTSEIHVNGQVHNIKGNEVIHYEGETSYRFSLRWINCTETDGVYTYGVWELSVNGTPA